MSAPDDIDLLAAEYALGTLDANERSRVSRRLVSDRELARAVEEWQIRLSPLSEATPAVEPPRGLYRAIETRLFGSRSHVRQLRYWQLSTGVCAAIAASLIAWIALSGLPAGSAPDRLFAVLQKDSEAPTMILDVDIKTRRLTIRSLARATPPGKAYELWLIGPAADAPRPLGVVPAHLRSETSLASYDPTAIASATYAVTLEPAGGSPDGKPSGSPILSGKLVASP